MGLRLKYSARLASSSTTLTLLGLKSSSALVKGHAAVAMGRPGLRSRRLTTPAMVAGCIAGSSPWMLSTASKGSPSAA